jgi:hypothetical protein
MRDSRFLKLTIGLWIWTGLEKGGDKVRTLKGLIRSG